MQTFCIAVFFVELNIFNNIVLMNINMIQHRVLKNKDSREKLFPQQKIQIQVDKVERG